MTKTLTPKMTLTELCGELQSLQRLRNSLLKASIKQTNSMLAYTAVALGYNSGDDEAERLRHYKIARKYVDSVRDGEAPCCTLTDVLRDMLIPAADGFDRGQEIYHKSIAKLAKDLPVAGWVLKPEQNGFGLGGLGGVIGEAGDLSRFATVAKLWKWMGCSPFTKGEHTLQGSTWRGKKHGSLSDEEWSKYGYNPRRRSTMYNVGVCLIKSNNVKGVPGPYYQKYLDEKKKKSQLPEWVLCGVCEGKKVTSKGSDCHNCHGSGEVTMHVHRHASLCMVKTLLRNLWCQWNKMPIIDKW